MSQQEFLQDAKVKLDLSWAEFAKRIGAQEKTMEKWTQLGADSATASEMPHTIWSLVREILAQEASKSKSADSNDSDGAGI